MEETQYTSDFYATQMPISLRSAKIILPIIFAEIHPKSILDVGCGTGVWLKIADEIGVKDYIGIDGEYVKTEMLEIPEIKFLRADLKNEFNLHKRFDLVISSEVAEHLPIETADKFISSLANHSDTILFSAAAPGQGGTHHINEQPQQYWVDKFNKHNYLPIDLLRERIWTKKGVDWWYKQNMILFVKRDLLNKNTNLKNLYEKFKKDNYNLSHPEMIFYQKNINSPLGRFFENPIYSIKKFISFTFS